MAAPGFSEHRIYWEEYGWLDGEPVIVMHGGRLSAAPNQPHGAVFRFTLPLDEPASEFLEAPH